MAAVAPGGRAGFLSFPCPHRCPTCNKDFKDFKEEAARIEGKTLVRLACGVFGQAHANPMWPRPVCQLGTMGTSGCLRAVRHAGRTSWSNSAAGPGQLMLQVSVHLCCLCKRTPLPLKTHPHMDAEARTGCVGLSLWGCVTALDCTCSLKLCQPTGH